MPKVEFIKEYAFFKCPRLKTITIGDKIKQIFMYSFRECYFTEMYIGNCNDVWCGYGVNSKTYYGSFTNADTFHGSWAYREMIKDPELCAEFFMGNFNRGSFVCTAEFVESIDGHYGSPSYPQDYELYPWQR